ncbi:MAG TPA: acyl-CoA dehydrogenase family protein [Acidimicrobiia bacterium]|jgi:alkylation response protein AidB-like acyl-CoA dehydrogenase
MPSRAPDRLDERLDVGPDTPVDDVRAVVRSWVATNVPAEWRDAAARGGHDAIRAVRTRAGYEAWYPVFAASGLVAATWPVEYGGLDLSVALARAAEDELAPYNLGRLNVLGLNSAAPALFAYGTDEQRLRFLPPIVRNEEKWCQLLSEPGAGSDLASLATRAVRDGDEWVLDGQKVWTTWAHVSDWAICLARTDPARPKRKGLTYFLVDLHAPGVAVRPLRHIGGEVDFNEVFLDGVRVPDSCRVGAEGEGWRVAGATLAGERKMVSGSGSGGVSRIGGAGVDQLVRRARELGRTDDPIMRQRIAQVYAEERIRAWTNARVAAAGSALTSIGKIHMASLNQRTQLLAADVLGAGAMAWDDAHNMPLEVRGMLRSRANTIEGGTSEVNKNVLGEKVLGLPREPDPYVDAAWQEVPRS